MTYEKRKKQEEYKKLNAKQKEPPKWELTEERVRDILRFDFDKHCRSLGIDGVFEDFEYTDIDGKRVSADVYYEHQELEQKMENGFEEFWDLHITLPFTEVCEVILGRKVTGHEDDRILELLWDDDSSRFKEIANILDFRNHFQCRHLITFLEVKTWNEQKVSASEIDSFVGKMIRGGAYRGIFVASQYVRSVPKVVRDHNSELEKINKHLTLMRMSRTGLPETKDDLRIIVE